MVCVNEYDVYEACKKGTYAYDTKRAQVNALKRAHKVLQCIESQ